MLVYEGTKSGFIEDVDLGTIAEKILACMEEKLHRRTGEAEVRSWQNSMQHMRGVLSDQEIPDNSGVAIEFNIPHTSNRIDFLLSGYDTTKNNSIVIIELKQWEHAEAVDKDGIVKTYVGHGLHEVTHPSYQAWSYASLINSYNQEVYDRHVGLHPCAFLHNYHITDDDPINGRQYQQYTDAAPMFGRGDVEKLRRFIKKHITEGDNKDGLYIIENGRIKPSKMLQDAFTSVLRGNREFVLIDDQKVIYEQALSLGLQTVRDDSPKSVLIVEGGPGTGKTVLAMNLLQEFLSHSLNTFYVTKNSAPRNVVKAKLKIDKMSSLQNLFQGSGKFTASTSNDYDVLITDEAHRLNAKSGMYQNMGENQVKEIINAAKFSIFFIDENQRVTLKDIGTISEIRKYAEEMGANVYKMDLKSQFRCDGSDGYLAWLDNVLEIRETANFDLDQKYDFRVIDSPNELRAMIETLNQKNNKSRIVAGYCWNWISGEKNNPDVHDIEIPEENFGMSWNLGNTATWAIDPESVREAGCIHTCQGLEFDYVGVIIGADIRYENGHIVTDFKERARTDKSLWGIKAIARHEGEDLAQDLAESIIKNTYRTLMTRGMKGCYVYCVDPGLREYLKSQIA